MLKVLSHVVVASAMLQMFPADMLDVEQRALDADRTESVYTIASLPKAQLPIASSVEQPPTKRNPNRLGVITSAVSAVVVDQATGEILLAKNIDEPRSIGSITKLMTAHVFLKDNPDLEQVVSLRSEDLRFGGIQHLSLSDTFTLRDILQASLIASDNTATAALVRLSGHSLGDFVAKMNEEAAQIGMQQTTFADATGLSSKNQSVVLDVSVLLNAVVQNETIAQITQTAQTTITGDSGRRYTLTSTDELLSSFINRSPYQIEVAKTGFLPEAGYCLGSLFSFEDDHEIMVVVLGSQTKAGRFTDVKALAEWTYDAYEWN